MELKKNPNLDYRKKSGLFFNIGLVLSLLFVISAFEWKFIERISMVDIENSFAPDETIIVPPTVHPPKKKPVIRQFNVIDIVDNKIDVPDIEVEIDIALDPVIDDAITDLAPLKDEKADEIYDIVQAMPSFSGGLQAFYRFVGENLKYPAQARRMGIDGKVYVHFVIDKDGSLSDINIVRGIGAGCDEEVLRIINMSPKWNPGKQRGNPVRVRMMLPISFVLE